MNVWISVDVAFLSVIAIGWYLALCVGNGGGDKGLE